jgi:hypothetical protein
LIASTTWDARERLVHSRVENSIHFEYKFSKVWKARRSRNSRATDKEDFSASVGE